MPSRGWASPPGRVDGLQGGQDVGAGGGPLGGVLGQEAHDERASRGRGQPAACQEGATGGGVQVLADDGDGVIAQEGGSPAHELVEHGDEGVEVGAGRDLAPHRLLGGM